MIPDVLSIVLAGDSHAMGYQQQQIAVKLEQSEQTISALLKPVWLGGTYFALDVVVTFPDGRLGLNPMLGQALSKWPGLDVKGRPLTAGQTVHKHVVLSLGTGLSANDPAFEYADQTKDRLLFKSGFDFVLPERPDLPIEHSSTILPVALIREMFTTILEPLKSALGILARDYPQRLWIVGSPPPPENNILKQKLMTDRARKFVAAGAAEISPDEITVPSPCVSLKLWLLVTNSVKLICEETGCTFIDCARIACDEKGYLRPEFEHDGVHGNAKYNELMARQIVSELVMRPGTQELPEVAN